MAPRPVGIATWPIRLALFAWDLPRIAFTPSKKVARVVSMSAATATNDTPKALGASSEQGASVTTARPIGR